MRALHAGLTSRDRCRQPCPIRYRQPAVGGIQQRARALDRQARRRAGQTRMHGVAGVQQHELVCCQLGSRGRGHVLGHEVEDLARGRVADTREQHDMPAAQMGGQAGRIDASYLAGMAVIHAARHAHRARGDQIAADGRNPGAAHRRAGQARRQMGLDRHLQAAHGLSHTGQSGTIGHAHAGDEVRRNICRGHGRIDLGPGPEDQHDLHAQ